MIKIKDNLTFALSLLALIICLSNCTYNNEEELYPIEIIEPTDTISYVDEVLPIIDTNCYSCHGNGAAVAGIDIDGYDKLVVVVENGSLLGTIKHEENYSPMPQGASKLSDSQIEKISLWIDQDYPNN